MKFNEDWFDLSWIKLKAELRKLADEVNLRANSKQMNEVSMAGKKDWIEQPTCGDWLANWMIGCNCSFSLSFPLIMHSHGCWLLIPAKLISILNSFRNWIK